MSQILQEATVKALQGKLNVNENLTEKQDTLTSREVEAITGAMLKLFLANTGKDISVSSTRKKQNIQDVKEAEEITVNILVHKVKE